MVILVLFLFLFFLIGFCAPHTDHPKDLALPDANKKQGDEKDEEESVAAFVGESEDLQVSQVRFNKQCYLIDKFEDFGHIANRPFKHFSLLTGDPAEVTNELVSKKKVQPLFQIKPYQLAFLQPTIRLFLLYSDVGSKDIDEIELNFASSFGVSSTLTSPSNLFKSANMGGAGAGIKSFSYELAGVNPAEADKLISATLVLYFHSVADLFAVRERRGRRDVRFADLINYSQRRSQGDPRRIRPERYQIKAVVGWAEPEIVAKQREGLISDALAHALVQSKTTLFLQLIDHTLSFQQEGNVELEIKYMASLQQTMETSEMDLFWLPEDLLTNNLKQKSSADGFLSAKSRRMRAAAAIEEAKVAIAQLRPVTANSPLDQAALAAIEKNFAEAMAVGTDSYQKQYGRPIQENIRYQAGGYEKDYRLDSEAFWDPDKTSVVPKLRDVLESDLRRERDPLGTKLNFDTATKTYLSSINTFNEEQEQVASDAAEVAQGLLEEMKARRREIIYRRIIEKLQDLDAIYVHEVDRDDVGLFGLPKGDIRVGTAKTTIDVRETRQKLDSAVSPPDTTDGLLSDAANAAKPGGKKAPAKIIESFNEKSLSDIKKAKADGKVAIYFFFFGDLVDAVLDILKGTIDIEGTNFENKPARDALDKFSILLGPAVFRGAEEKGVVVNVAQIPISLELFLQWFLDKVVKSQRTSYQFRDFLKDAVKNLIIPALGQGCYNGNKQSGKMAMIPLTIPSMDGGKGRIPRAGAKCILADIRRNKAKELRPQHVSDSSNKVNNYLYFFIEDDLTKVRKVDEERDVKSGIYHLRLGEDRGIVKSIDFHQTDIQFLKEARIADDADVKDGFLRKKYDANIKTIGNALFAPGQYIYIHPTVQGSDSVVVRENLQKIGLGGYYLVTKIFHILSAEYYQAEIDAKWEAYGATKNSSRVIPKFPISAISSGGTCTPRNAKERATYAKKTDPEKYDLTAAERKSERAEERDNLNDTSNYLIGGGLVAMTTVGLAIPGAIAVAAGVSVKAYTEYNSEDEEVHDLDEPDPAEAEEEGE